MFDNVYFYNTFHNGDIHHSRNFVKDIMKKISSNNYYYLHNNNSEILKDIPDLKYDKSFISFDNWNLITKYPIHFNNMITHINNDLYINTWVGQSNFITSNNLNRNRNNRYCSLYSHYELYEDIFNKLNIKIEDIEYYIPEIDYNYIQKKEIDDFVSNKNKIVFVSNNIPQTVRIELDINNVVYRLSNEFNNVTFVLTNILNDKIIKDNVYYVSDIIKLKFDLNEISYLSKFCDILVGKPSGPYCFSFIKENLKDKNKNFLTISNNIYDMFYFESKSNMIFIENHTEEYLYKKIRDLLC
jgi:hypothetical protein